MLQRPSGARDCDLLRCDTVVRLEQGIFEGETMGIEMVLLSRALVPRLLFLQQPAGEVGAVRSLRESVSARRLETVERRCHRHAQ